MFSNINDIATKQDALSQATNSNILLESTKEFTKLITPQIEKQTFKSFLFNLIVYKYLYFIKIISNKFIIFEYNKILLG